MTRWGRFDFKEFERFAEQIKKLADGKVLDEFIRDFLFEMGMRALRKTRKRTPVGKNTPNPGNLRRSWKLGDVEKRGNEYLIELYNDARNEKGEPYGSFVEYGHRTGKNLTKWVEGRFMMTISMNEIERELPQYLEKRFTQKIKDILNGKG